MLHVIRVDEDLSLEKIIKKHPPTLEEPVITDEADEEVDYYLVPLTWWGEDEDQN